MSDDEDNAAQNSTSEHTPHGDFDLASIYSSLNQEVPSMDRILSGARKFGNSHRHLINQFCLEPTMSAKKMNLVWAKHFTTVKLKRHPEVVMRIQATPETSKELTKTLMKTMNTEEGISKKTFRPWHFVLSTDEKTPTEYVTMTGCTRNSSIISEASDLTKAERALFFAIVEEMMTSDGAISTNIVYKMIQQEPFKMPGHKCDVFMTRMIRQQYFKMDDEKDFYEIAPRTLVELEAWIRAKFAGDLKICTLCRKIIARPAYTAECTKCQTLFHFNCFTNATVIADQFYLECGKCGEKITKDEVAEQIDTKKIEARTRARSRSYTPKPAAPVVDISNDGAEETVKMEVTNDTDEDESQVGTSEVQREAPKRMIKRRLVITDSDSE